MRILKFTLAAVFALLMTSCLTNAILSTVVVDKKTAEVRAYGDRFIVNVKCAVTVKVTVDAKSKDWIHVSDTKFNPGLGDGYNLEVITDASTYNYKTSGVITIAIDEESFAEVKVEREALDKYEVRDVEGHTYGVALINGKYWMTENLRSLTYDTKSEARGQNIRMVEDGTGFTGKACTDPSRLSDLGTMEGIYIAKVIDDGAAADAGLKEGDVITHIDGQKVKAFGELQNIIAQKRPGDKISINYLRNKAKKTATLTLKNEKGNTKVVKDADIDVLGGQFRPVTDAQKEQFNIGYGLQVIKVSGGKLKDAGVPQGFIIQRINEESIKTIDDLQKIVKDANKSKEPVLYIQGIYPTGKKGYFAVPLEDE